MDIFSGKIRLPVPGQRILRSMLAAWACMAVYYLRGMRGLPFFSVIAALQCIQPYTDNMLSMGRKRVIGTLVGAAWGAAVLYLENLAVGSSGVNEMLHFILMGAIAGAVIYSTVLLNIPESSYFSAVVFLSIAMNHVADAELAVYITDRVLDTTIGVIVGILVNSLHLPRVRRNDILFISGIDPILSGEEHHMAPYTKVELNRLIRDGALFTVITKESPAMVQEAVAGISLKYPAIVLDGAVVVDIASRTYLKAEKIGPELGEKLEAFFRREDAGYFINTIEDNLLVTFYHEMREGPMKRLYRRKSGSLYRNFVHTERDVRENIINFVTVGEEHRIRDLGVKLKEQAFSGEIRLDFDASGCDKGELILRVYAASATRERMIAWLRQSLKAKTVVKFGRLEPAADERIPYVGDRMVKEIKKRFETVDLRGWRNILRP